MKYKSIFISDSHLGSKDCKAELLNNFLKHNESDNLFLVGDIIDGWKIQRGKWQWKTSHTNVIRRILNIANKGTQVTYITGNHDEFLRPFVAKNIHFSNIELCNKMEYTGVDGKKYLITHGDMFDGISKLAPWISFLGDTLYDMILSLNSKFNYMSHKMGFGYFSVSKYLKYKVKSAMNFVFDFEDNIADYCKRKGYDGVICGHIHTPSIKVIDSVVYMNDGDWVESCSALVEHYDGKWEIVYWTTLVGKDE